MQTIELLNNKRINIQANTLTEIVLNDYVQGFNVLLMQEANVVIKPLNNLKQTNETSLEDMEGYLLNSFCRGFELYEQKQFQTILVISDTNTSLQFLNIR